VWWFLTSDFEVSATTTPLCAISADSRTPFLVRSRHRTVRRRSPGVYPFGFVHPIYFSRDNRRGRQRSRNSQAGCSRCAESTCGWRTGGGNNGSRGFINPEGIGNVFCQPSRELAIQGCRGVSTWGNCDTRVDYCGSCTPYSSSDHPFIHTPHFQQGVTSTNSRINVVEFFSNNVFQDLQALEGTVHPILQVDAIRFLNTFRNQVR
jgi:hypothetical protein